jgi:glucose/arabinose dehydrogenase
MTSQHPHLRRALVAVTATAMLALSGCGDSDSDSSDTPTPSTSSASTDGPKTSDETSTPPSVDEVEVDVTITGDDVTPIAQEVELGVGETLLLNINSDRAGEVHVHSSPEQELEFEAGSSQLDITLDKPGSVDIEEHESDSLLVRVLVK